MLKYNHLGFPPLATLPLAGREKRTRNKSCLSEASFFCFPLFPSRQRGSQRRRGRLFWPTFFGDAKKVGSRRATPGMPKLLQIHFASKSEKFGVRVILAARKKTADPGFSCTHHCLAPPHPNPLPRGERGRKGLPHPPPRQHLGAQRLEQGQR